MDADLFTKGAMAAHDGEKSTGNRIFCIVVMCSGFAFARSAPRSPPPWDPRASFEHSRARLNHHLIDVTPSPVFARLERSNDGVLGLAEVLRGVFVFRRVAESDIPSGLAGAQMGHRVILLLAILAHDGSLR